MQMSQSDMMIAALKEVWRIRKFAVTLFILVAVCALLAGWFWPRVYVSSSVILVDEQNILKPLMEGTAVATEVVDQAKNAKQLLSGQYAKEKILNASGDDLSNLSPSEQDYKWERILNKITVSNVGKGLISIEYRTNSPEDALKYATLFTDLFISESIKSKRIESEDAYNFIASQALSYHEKLKQSEESLKEFRSSNLGASPESSTTVTGRILELQRSIEETQLAINETQIQLKNIEDQLTGEAEVSSYMTEEGQIQIRISTLEGQLDTLRMTYLDTYPDIVILKDQIESLRQQMAEVSKKDKKKITNTGNLNPLFQELRSQYSQNTTQLATLKTRLYATKKLLMDELDRAKQINVVGTVLAELTRDYDVNKDLYQKLLRQRETARVSMNIDIANQGLTLKVQEAPSLPVRPVGLRLMHFLIVGIVMAFMAPLGIAYAMVMFDGKVRSAGVLQGLVMAPVLGGAPIYKTREYNVEMIRWGAISVAAFVLIIALYAVVAWIRVIH